MKSKKISKTLVYIVSIATALAAGGISSVFAMSAMKEYGALKQPPLAPPPWLFPVVWTILFVLMGISAARIYIVGKQDRSGGTVRCGDNSDIGGQAACANRTVCRKFCKSGYRRAGGVCAPRLPRSAHFEYALDAAVFHA